MIAAAAAAALALAATEVNGYLDSRTHFTRARVDGLIDTRDLPELWELLEANVQLKHSYAERGFVSADLSLFAQAAGIFRTLDESGSEVGVPGHPVPSNTPLVSLSELYVSHDVRPELNLLLGRKRVVWGPGFAANPTDLLNPRKDPTDPTFQRAGAWMARVEVPLERLTFTALFAPQVTAEASGIPSRLLYYPAYDPASDGLPHYLLGARAYALVADSDLNLMAYFSQRYRDPLESSVRLGASFSRIFFDALELHAEALGFAGSARAYPAHDCLTDLVPARDCLSGGTPLLERRRANGEGLTAHALLGARYQLDDNTFLQAEYLFQSDGYTRRDLQSLFNALGLLRAAAQLGLDPREIGAGLGQEVGDGTPQKFAFEPLGRHHLFLTFQRAKIRDDFTLGATAIASLTDLSGLLSPSVSWQATEWLTLTASGFIPFPGVTAWSAVIPGTDTPVGEYTFLPMVYRAVLQARAYY